jgi:hypothetical protein
MPRPSKERVEQLREATQAAFPIDWPPMPSQMTADVCEDCNEVAERLRGRAWSSLSAQEVEALGDAITLLSARALRYYMPAVILRGLAHPGSRAVAALLARLGSRDEMASWRDAHRLNAARTREELLAQMPPTQLAALRGFAEWASAYANLRAAAALVLEAYASHETSNENAPV